jgi:fumarate reductase (CoM/CoB) subunit B
MPAARTSIDERSILKCVRCGTCRSVCPVFDELGWESSSTRGRMLIIKRLQDGKSASSDDLNSLGTCTTCGICTESCPAGVEPPDLIECARKDLAGSGIMTEKQAILNEDVRATGNVFGETAVRQSWLSDPAAFRNRADYVYFAGCLASFRYPKVAAKTFDLLRRFDVTMLKDERCCGSPLLRTGFNASSVMESNKRQIREIGAKTVIIGCAGCYSTLKEDYQGEFEVVSIPEFLAVHISSLDIEPLDLTVTYHDPCHLGRRHKIYDEPRKVIEAICSLKEMKASRNRSRCCGGGGGVRSGYNELSLKMARKRLLDVPDGVDFIVTSCPLCIRNLNDAGGGGKVIDLVELVSMAFNDEEMRL